MGNGKSNGKRYLVTGGGGFIGSHIARRLLSQGGEVVVIDDLSTGYNSNVPEGAQLVDLDISQPGNLSRIPDGSYDAVLHLAAQSSGEISHEDPSRDLNTNALGTLLLLEWARQRQVSRFMYASSMAIYGLTEQLPARECQPLDPYSFYGIAKQAAEQYVRHYSHGGMNTTAMRMFNVYGPSQNLANMKQGMISIYLAYLLQEQTILVKGSMDRFRDFIYIDDVVDAWMAALDNTKSHGRVYNVASGRKTSVRELVAELVTAWGYDPETYTVEHGDGTPGDQFGIYADIGLISDDLGWRPQVDLPEGLRRMTEWVKSQSLPAGPVS